MHLTLQGYYLSRVIREIEIQGDKQKYLVSKNNCVTTIAWLKSRYFFLPPCTRIGWLKIVLIRRDVIATVGLII